MRVLYFSRDYSPHDHRFLSVLAESEHQVAYVRLQRGPRQVEDRPVPARIEQVHWAGGKGLFRWRDVPRLVASLREVIRRFQPDLIHAGPIQDVGLVATLTGFRPILIMSWGFDLMQDAERNAWWRWATRYVLRRATFFTSDAGVTRRKAIAYGMDPERTVVFPWGVDLSRFHPRTPSASPPSTPSTFTLFCNRSWEPRYGVDVLARAFVRAARRISHLRLLLLGGGSQAQVIQRILREGGVWERVSMPGYISQNDLPRWYHMADLYISPSHIDGSSVSLMEALACGLPCLVSDIPANKEWVTDGVNGWLFPDGDVDALAAAIERAVEQRERLPEMGRAARRVAEARADWEKNVMKLFEAYRRAVQAAGPSQGGV